MLIAHKRSVLTPSRRSPRNATSWRGVSKRRTSLISAAKIEGIPAPLNLLGQVREAPFDMSMPDNSLARPSKTQSARAH